ncbi:hypothetical protein [Nonomuraea coxensis]|uniref:hypothetical protein n=1 Tax=Nonomuraea coxensis TaxID=404386 RepID=UPI0003788E0D|nr:hypothetical protein [Nonomuraea coxensis]
MASAAAAASHPGGTRTASGTTDTGARDGTPQPEQPVFLTALTDVLGPRADRAAFDRVALLQRRLEALDGPGRPPRHDARLPRGDVWAPRGDVWVPHGDVWAWHGDQWDTVGDMLAPFGDVRVPRGDLTHPRGTAEGPARPPFSVYENREPSGEQANTRARERSGRPSAEAPRSPVRTGVVRMPRARPHVVHNRSRVLGKQGRVDLTRVLPRQAAIRMSHATADGWLRSAGLRMRSTGNCTDKHRHHCTSLDRVRTGTVARIIQLKQESRCPIQVTGGTEDGHAPGQFSHGNGYKLDISHNSCIDRYITTKHKKSGVRGDGARLYRSSSGTTFADESDHWDILFR